MWEINRIILRDLDRRLGIAPPTDMEVEREIRRHDRRAWYLRLALAVFAFAGATYWAMA